MRTISLELTLLLTLAVLAGPAAVAAVKTVVLVRSLIRDNEPAGAGRARVAVDTGDLIARGSVVHHEARACFVTGSVAASGSLARDPSCGF